MQRVGLIHYLESSSNISMIQEDTESSKLAFASCPSCNSKRIADKWPTTRIPGNKMILWCANCGFGWQNPLPSPSDIRYYYHRFPTYSIQGTQEKEQGFKRRIQRINELAPHGSHLLDVGSGLGHFLKVALQSGWKATGIEPQQSAAEYCRKHLGIKPHVGPIEEFEFKPKVFDVVTIWDVWEHIHSPLDFIERCIGLLGPGGLLALSIPNAAGYPARLFKGHWRYVMFTHLSYFTLTYVHRVMAERNMLFQRADHTVKAQSLLQGLTSLLSINLNTEKIIRFGREGGSEDSIAKKKANLSIAHQALNRIRQFILRANLYPLPITKGDMMDLYFKKDPKRDL